MSPIPFLDVGATYRELADELDAAARRVLSSGRYVLGDEVEAFEAEWAAYCGTTYCVGVGNGLEALHLALVALGVGPGDEVIVPSNTYIASWLAVTMAGATPVPVEPDSRTYNLDPNRVEDAVTGRTRVIMAVHLHGLPADVASIREIADRRDLPVLEDAAQAHGARHQGKRCGALGRAAGWSFYPTKNLGAYGDGGAVTTDDSALAARLRLIRNYGARSRYDHAETGFNSRLDPIQAAFLRVRLTRLDAWNARRRESAARYLEGLAAVPGLTLPSTGEQCSPCWHQFVVRHAFRDELQRWLSDGGVPTIIHYPTPPHRSGAYARMGLGPGSLPLAEELAREILSLPMGPHLSLEDQGVVLERIRSWRSHGCA